MNIFPTDFQKRANIRLFVDVDKDGGIWRGQSLRQAGQMTRIIMCEDQIGYLHDKGTCLICRERQTGRRIFLHPSEASGVCRRSSLGRRLRRPPRHSFSDSWPGRRALREQKTFECSPYGGSDFRLKGKADDRTKKVFSEYNLFDRLLDDPTASKA